MAKFIFALCLLLIVISRSVVGGQAQEVGECRIGLGECAAGNGCEEACKSHYGVDARGDCDRTFKPSLCNCYVPCPTPPRPRPSIPPPSIRSRCHDSLGLCSFHCNEACCNSNCVQKHPGGSGICNQVNNMRLCLCDYPCA